MLSIEYGSRRLELSFKNTISLQLIFLYHGFKDASPLKEPKVAF